MANDRVTAVVCFNYFYHFGLYLYTILLTQVFHYFGWEEFGGWTDAVGFEKGTIGSEPATKSLGTDTRRAGKFGFGIRLHILLVG